MNIIVLRRRLIYISAIVLLLIPLYILGRPSVRDADGSTPENGQGGMLAQIRGKYDLGQGDLGSIDPASESMRLATLGLRGVAATILWQKAEYYKKEQYWDRLSATLQQIAILQPHFIKVWEFQGHNLAYNVSGEFDDYRQRYQWVKKGLEYLIKGAKYNKKRTEMPYELGWFFGNKLGVADERKQYRAMYADDTDFHNEVRETSGMVLDQVAGLGPNRKPDNWLSGVLWYERAYDMVDSGLRPAKSTMMFYRMGPQWLMKYSDGIQDEGIVDEAARQAWNRAGKGWDVFGDRRIVTSFGDEIYLRELERANQEYARLTEEFSEFCGDTYTKQFDAVMATLTSEEIAAWEKQDIDRTFDEVLLAEQVGKMLEFDPALVARQTSADIRTQAIQMAKELAVARSKISHIEIYRNQINYAYWEARCEAEQEDEAILARTNMFEATQALERGELDEAIRLYDIAWDNWNGLFNKHPAMMIDDAADEVLKEIEDYRRLLDSDLPEDFLLADFMKFRAEYDDALADPAMMSVIAFWPKRFPGRDFLTEMLRKTALIAPEADLSGEDLLSPSDGDSSAARPEPNIIEQKVETPAEETPAEETPAEETPAEETPAEETPAEETPAEETPAAETPAEETPAEETPAAETPAAETPSAETPAEETPAEETPAEETSAEETPAEETPAEETSAEETPAEETPAEETPAEEDAPKVVLDVRKPVAGSAPVPDDE